MITYPEKYFLGAATIPFAATTMEQKLDHGIYLSCGVAAEIEMLGTGVGAEMIREIDASPHTIEVVSGLENACFLTGDLTGSCYREVASDDALVDKLHALLNSENYAQKTPAGIKLLSLIKQNTTAFSMIEGKPGPLGVKPLIIVKFATNDPGRGKICYAIREHLTPGAGANAMVRWNHERSLADNGKGTITAAWNNRPPWLALAHELIHAWRIVTGKCIFPKAPESAYEEAMTVGLMPYNGCKYTENAFRVAAGQPPRNFYGQSDQMTSKSGWVSARPSPFAQRNNLI